MNIERFRNYSVEEFLEDPTFRSWVRHPTLTTNDFWECFLETYPHQEITVQLAKEQLTQMDFYFRNRATLTSVEAENFRKNLLQTMEEAKVGRKINGSRRVIIRRIAVAASLLVVIGICSWYWFGQSEAMQVYATGFEEWKTMLLPDGSTVKLNANSELRTADHWEKGADRIVWLRGEAFFEVEKKPETKAKFQVITDDLTVEVLGTSFNVHSRGNQTNVYLEEGKIRLDLGEDEKFLDPGELIAYSSQKKAITEQYKSSAEKHISWKDGTLFLKNTPTTEILKKIEEIYGVAIKIENEAIFSQVKTVGVPMDKLELAIPILERTLNVKIIQLNKQLVIK